MRAIWTVVVAVVLLGLFGAVADTDAGDVGDSFAGELDGLRDCGPMRWGEARPECVRHLQQVLRARGAPMDVTGNYLRETTRYIKEFQAGRGLHQDGVLDKPTLDALAHLPDGPDRWDLRRDCVSLRQPTGEAAGSQGSCVTTLRARLAVHGIAAGRGATFDGDAAAAVRTFQQRAGLPQIGIVGPQTRLALYLQLPRPSPGQAGCTVRGCLIIIGRADTRGIASAFPDNAFVRALLAEVISAAVCARIRAMPAVHVACQAVGSYIIDTVAGALNTAARRNACLRVAVGYPPGQRAWFPLQVTPDNGPKCAAASGSSG
ncbi:peptidoglycan-binding domain-containing protein [Phytohabitans houttuyneae]|uniref:Peptidoglycan binding-like domain-containing protein n=1 Tax=Phytohabitans houttuyneae TaxID=1076126 RepID=A0A6V8KF68_9ACTN|nr:peptidoglycan-binding protein [Phytohabitans houttuyneae]GFJ81008.1 hypothetical protein Phou_051880 [Phytohabitans houttuyneae]